MVPDLTQAADSMNKRRALVVKLAEVSVIRNNAGIFPLSAEWKPETWKYGSALMVPNSSREMSGPFHGF